MWAWLERRGARAPRATLREPLFIWAGVFFAGDLLLWHWSLLLTSIAAATLEANCAPLLVTLLAWLLWKERPRPAFLFAIALAFGGMLLILAPKLGGGSHALLGDALGLGTACFYAAYFLVVARLRTRYGTGIVMLTSTAVFTLILLPLALTQKIPSPNAARLVAARRLRDLRAGAGTEPDRLRARTPARDLQRRGPVHAGGRRGRVRVAAAR